YLSLSSDGVLTLDRRTDLLRSLDQLPRKLDEDDRLSTVDSFQQQALSILVGGKVRAAFDISQEQARTRGRYGDTHWGRSLLTCRRLIEAGVRFVQCPAEFRLPQEVGRPGTWDDASV